MGSFLESLTSQLLLFRPQLLIFRKRNVLDSFVDLRVFHFVSDLSVVLLGLLQAGIWFLVENCFFVELVLQLLHTEAVPTICAWIHFVDRFRQQRSLVVCTPDSTCQSDFQARYTGYHYQGDFCSPQRLSVSQVKEEAALCLRLSFIHSPLRSS